MTTQERFKSKYVWISIFALVTFILGEFGLYKTLGITSEAVQTIIDSVLNILVLVGVLNNPTDKVNW